MTPSRVPGAVAASVVVLSICGCAGVASGGSASDSGVNADGQRGAEATVGGTSLGACSDVIRAPASASYVHVAPGTDMDYAGVPPVSGSHWGTWEDLSTRRVFTVDERPDLGQLVHSQEHGWTIVWYDETIDSDSLESVATEVADHEAQKIAFVPWTAEDGVAFPDGSHVAMTHWGYAAHPGEEYRQFCTEADVAAILAFTQAYPYSDSREPNAP